MLTAFQKIGKNTRGRLELLTSICTWHTCTCFPFNTKLIGRKLNIILPIMFALKLPSAWYVCYVYSNALILLLIMEANIWTLIRLLLMGQSDLSPYCLQYRLSKFINRRKMNKVESGGKRVSLDAKPNLFPVVAGLPAISPPAIGR